jgi:hypothetical protein
MLTPMPSQTFVILRLCHLSVTSTGAGGGPVVNPHVDVALGGKPRLVTAADSVTIARSIAGPSLFRTKRIHGEVSSGFVSSTLFGLRSVVRG